MSREKQIESTDWLTKGISKEQVEREKQVATMSGDLVECHTEFYSNAEIYTNYDETAEKMYGKGYRKQSEGEWQTAPDGTHWCSECGHDATYTFDGTEICGVACPFCGAKMKGGE
jgi:hypothetical protein